MMNRTAVLERYYLDCRCMLLELAATLDRLDEAAARGHEAIGSDVRLRVLQQAITVLAVPSGAPDRAERILNLYSDPQ